MPHRPAVLVLGATGRCGQAACAAFAAAGWQVLAQRRPRPGAARAADACTRWIEADPADAATLARAVAAADVVVHALNPAYTDAAWRREAPALLEAAIAQALRLDALLLFPGNVYGFGAGMPAVLREDAPARPTTVKGQVRVALEARLAQAARTQGLRSVVLRAGDFFGAGTGSLLDMVLARKLRRGRIGLPGPLDVATPYAYLPDLARAAVAVAEHRATLDGMRCLHFAGHQLTGADWCGVLADVARGAGWLAPQAHARVEPVPWRAVRILGLALPAMASLAESRYLWATPHALDNGRLQALIGPEPRTPLPQAVRAALDDLGWHATVPGLHAA